jgi:hypothetical protein
MNPVSQRRQRKQAANFLMFSRTSKMNQNMFPKRRTEIKFPSWTKIRAVAVMTSQRNNSCWSARKYSVPFSIFVRNTA